MRRLYESLIPIRELIEMLKERQSRMWDKVVSAENLRVDGQTGNLLVTNGRTTEHPMQSQAFGLLCAKLRVPAGYASRCSPRLQAENFNTWLDANPSREFMLRFDTEACRAVLSARYQPVTNYDLARTVHEQLGNVVVRAEVDATRMILQVVTDRGIDVTPGDRVFGGAQFGNSETGHHVTSAKALSLRTICVNSLIVGGSGTIYRRKHLTESRQVLREFRTAIVDAASAGEELPLQMRALHSIRIPDHVPVLRKIEQRYRFSDEESDALHRAWDTEPGGSLYHIVQSVTKAGNDRALDADRRLRMQELGGHLLQLAQQGQRWID